MSFLLMISSPDLKGPFGGGRLDGASYSTNPEDYGPEGTVHTIKVFDSHKEAQEYSVEYAAKNPVLNAAGKPGIAFHFAEIRDGVISVNVETVRPARRDEPSG